MDFIVKNNRRYYESVCNGCGNTCYKRTNHKKPHYCTSACYGLSIRNREMLACHSCGSPTPKTRTQIKNSESGNVYCSRSCSNRENTKGKRRNFIDGRGAYRVKALKHHGQKCNRCDFSECDDILQVHHKDRDRSNNEMDNLEVLCPNCHHTEHFLAHDGMYHSRK